MNGGRKQWPLCVLVTVSCARYQGGDIRVGLLLCPLGQQTNFLKWRHSIWLQYKVHCGEKRSIDIENSRNFEPFQEASQIALGTEDVWWRGKGSTEVGATPHHFLLLPSSPPFPCSQALPPTPSSAARTWPFLGDSVGSRGKNNQTLVSQIISCSSVTIASLVFSPLLPPVTPAAQDMGFRIRRHRLINVNGKSGQEPGRP